MDSLDSPLVRLLIVAFFVLLNGFFVAAEFAFISVRRTRIQELVESGNKRAMQIERASQDPSRFVSTVQVGVTMTSLALGWLGEPAIAELLDSPMEAIGLQGAAVHTVSFIIAFLIITYLHVVVGEVAPKAFALQRSERVALATTRWIVLFHALLKPLIFVLYRSAQMLLGWMNTPIAGMHPIHSEEELKMLVSQSSKGGVLEDTEQEMLYNVFDFADTDVAEVMVPRPDVVALSIDLPPTELLHTVLEQPYTRYPVYRDTMDDVAGILHVRDLFNAAEKNGKDRVRIESLLRPAHVVPESKSLAGLLADFRRSKSHMALVVDEYGSLAGIVTLEDLIEEIVGEIDDEHDLPETPVERIDENHLRIDGKFPVEELNERFALDIPEDEDYHTIGGFVFSALGQQPHEGDVVMHGRVRMEVTETDGPRIVHVDVHLLERKEAREGEPSVNGNGASHHAGDSEAPHTEAMP